MARQSKKSPAAGGAAVPPHSMVPPSAANQTHPCDEDRRTCHLHDHGPDPQRPPSVEAPRRTKPGGHLPSVPHPHVRAAAAGTHRWPRRAAQNEDPEPEPSPPRTAPVDSCTTATTATPTSRHPCHREADRRLRENALALDLNEGKRR
ncbi:hypothetical protein PVAP13_3KG219854 [Panicum virgatum]|uniref:Uncharacterized protein n=1 Tax=Panicum virgatum TaxID=38727 RepID=A0A8T0URI4_PANVG|nr:hypothetical protein PVAP13_3KG219854 [Panicum virgatum]